MANRIKLTPLKKAAFIETLRENGGDATRAARRHRITRTCLYEHRKKDPDFDKAWTEAVIESTAALEDEAVHRAITGKSDTMLIFTLKARKPDVYRESFKHEHGGPGGGPIPTHTTHAVDLSKLSDDELAVLRAIAARQSKVDL